MTNNNTYTSRDFYLSAYLIAAGNDLQTYSKDAMGLTTFIFLNSQELLEHVRKYYSLEAMVNPVEYGNAQRSLKSIIHEKETTHPNYKHVEQVRTSR